MSAPPVPDLWLVGDAAEAARKPIRHQEDSQY